MTTISATKRLRIYHRDKFKCQICGIKVDENAQIDHITPKTREGSNQENNLATVCKNCNLKRGNRMSYDYIKVGCFKNFSWIKTLIAYEKKFEIFDEKQFSEKLFDYQKELKKEIQVFNSLLTEGKHHES